MQESLSGLFSKRVSMATHRTGTGSPGQGKKLAEPPPDEVTRNINQCKIKSAPGRAVCV